MLEWDGDQPKRGIGEATGTLCLAGTLALRSFLDKVVLPIAPLDAQMFDTRTMMVGQTTRRRMDDDRPTD